MHVTGADAATDKAMRLLSGFSAAAALDWQAKPPLCSYLPNLRRLQLSIL